jgi:basic membrane protein A
MPVNERSIRFPARFLAVVLVLTVSTGCAKKTESDSASSQQTRKSTVKAAMVTDVGGLGDRSFNDLSYAGLQRAQAEFGVDIKVLESREIADYASNIDQLARAGYSPIFTVGFLMQDALAREAPNYADTKFGAIDEFFESPAPNVAGILFKEQEAGYLAGVVAGLVTRSSFDPRLNPDNTVGFVGGMDIPPVERYEVGFVAGVKSVNPDVRVLILYAGKFDDQAKGKEIGLSLIDQKADVIFAAAGQSGLGTIKACQERGALFIGVDADQFETVPGSGDVMLTSAVKRLDVAVYNTVKAVVEGTWTGGHSRFYGIEDAAVGLAPYHDFESKVPMEIKDAVAKASQDIVNRAVVVPDARS